MHIDRLADGNLIAVYTALLSAPILTLAEGRADPERLTRFLDQEQHRGVALECFREALA